MDKLKIKEYSERYKKVQKRLAIGVSVFVFLIGAGIIAGALVLLLMGRQDLILVEIVMLLAALADIFLGVKFLTFTFRNLKCMKPVEAAMRYSRITGKSLEEEKNND